MVLFTKEADLSCLGVTMHIVEPFLLILKFIE